MSSVSGPSDHIDLFAKISGLDQEEQNKYIDDASSEEIIKMFERTLDCSCPGKLVGTLCDRVQKLRDDKALNSDQIKTVGLISGKLLSFPKGRVDSETEIGLDKLLYQAISPENLGELVACALEIKSETILNSCLSYILDKTGIYPDCDNFGPLKFEVSLQHFGEMLASLNTILSSLKKHIPPESIEVSILRNFDDNFPLDTFITFAKEQSDIIRSLSISSIRGPDADEKLKEILRSCINLKLLGISYCDITDRGLVDLHRLTKLVDFDIQYCKLLVEPPDVTSLINLKSINLTGNDRMTAFPVLTGLSQLESLELQESPLVENPPDLTGLMNLTYIAFHGSKSLKTLPDFSSQTKLETITLTNCDDLSDEPRIAAFKQLLETNPKFLPKQLFMFGIKDTRDLESIIAVKDLQFYCENLQKFSPPNKDFRRHLLSELFKNEPEKAIRYVYYFTQDSALSVDDKEVCSHAVEEYCLSNHPNKALRLAIDLDDIALAEKALNAGASMDLKAFGSPPLLRACRYGSAQMVNLLLDRGANAIFLGGTHQHSTPLGEARLRGDIMADCIPRLTEKDAGFTDEVIELKLLAHKFSIGMKSKVDGKEFYSEGFRNEYIVRDYVKKNSFFYEELKREILDGSGRILDSFSEEIKTLLQPILEDTAGREKFVSAIDMTFSGIEHSTDHDRVDIHSDGGRLRSEILRDLNEGKPVISFGITQVRERWVTGAEGLHSWGVVVTKDSESGKYFVNVCNRGYGAAYPGIMESKLDEEQMFEIIGKFQELSNWKMSEEWVADRFLSDLKYSKTLAGDVRKLIRQKAQTVGNCCYYSLQSIELALLKEVLKPILGEEGGVVVAKEIKRVRTSQMRLKDLQVYLESHSPGAGKYPVDWNLLASIFIKCRVKPKLSRYNDLILDYARRAIDAGDSGVSEIIKSALWLQT